MVAWMRKLVVGMHRYPGGDPKVLLVDWVWNGVRKMEKSKCLLGF